jgi:hypothetical protein
MAVRLTGGSLGSLDSYIGQNAYGAKTKVIQSRSQDYGVAICNLPDPITVPTATTFEIPMTPERAREEKKRFGLLIVCKPKNCLNPARLTHTDLQVTKPTFSNPWDSVERHTYLSVEAEVWLYDTVTGEVIKKEPMGKQ